MSPDDSDKIFFMTRLQEELNHLRESLFDMAVLVRTQIKKSVCALLDGDEDLATEVLVNEKRVNAFELNIDRDCEQIFALLNPVANDMRFVFATLNNLATLTSYSGYDPDVTARRNDPLTPGVDFAAYPRSRTWVFGLNVTF